MPSAQYLSPKQNSHRHANPKPVPLTEALSFDVVKRFAIFHWNATGFELVRELYVLRFLVNDGEHTAINAL